MATPRQADGGQDAGQAGGQAPAQRKNLTADTYGINFADFTDFLNHKEKKDTKKKLL
jgi:hypothetical protein